MNNPKEKAKELFNKYCYAIRTEETDSGYFTNVIYAKQCAIIAVDEILKLEQARLIVGNHNYYDYYIEVKKELEKL
jgi:hypothetical protein